MSAYSQIRTLIQDKPLTASEDVTLVAGQTTIGLKYLPTLSASVIITGTAVAFSVDEPTGVITFVSAPGALTLSIRYSHVFFLDADLQDFIDVEGVDADVRLAAADALDALATNQALLLKKVDLLDAKFDGPAVAKALREHATTLRKQVFSPDFEEAAFDIAEQINDAPGWIEKVHKDWQREDL